MFLILKKFSLRVIIPSVSLIILVNLLLSESHESNPHKRIEEALASGNYDLAKAEYRKLIQDNFFKVEYHRGYIRSHLRLSERTTRPSRRDNQDIIEGYRRYASASAPEVSDIGYYGLGFFYGLQTDDERARENFLHVRNTRLPYLNYSLGAIYSRTGRRDLAKQHFDREIQLGGIVTGAYSNLAVLLFATKQYSEFKQIAARPEAKNSSHWISDAYLRYERGGMRTTYGKFWVSTA